MQIKEIFPYVDHTLLNQTAVWTQVQQLCDEGIQYQTASVCISPAFVKQASDYLQGRLPICTVVGFPNGSHTTEAKAYETKEAIENGASEIDMVINLGWVKEQHYDQVTEEIRKIKSICQEHILKVIVETCLLEEAEKIHLCNAVTAAGADFIKTSTGFSTSGATFKDISLFKEHIGADVKIKAAGGITTVADAVKFIALGATRLGTSRIIKLAREQENFRQLNK